MNIERKSYPITEFKADDQTGVIEAIVSVFSNVDSGNEKVMPGFFTKSIERKLPKGVWAHDWKQPIAKTLEAKEISPGDPILPDSLKELGGAYIKGQFNLDTQRGREAYSDIKFGIVDEFSIGYKVLKEGKDKDSGARELIEGDWKEWSPVLVGMNAETRLISIKSEEDGDPPAEAKGMFEDTIADRESSLYFLWDVLCSALYRAQAIAEYDVNNTGPGAFDLSAAVDEILSEFSARVRAAIVGDGADMTVETASLRGSISFKGDLRDRLPFAKHAETALGAVEVFAQKSAAVAEIVTELTERSKAIQELREAKAGATYSGANLSHMQRIHSTMKTVKKTVNAMHDDMAALIEKAKPKEKSDGELDVAALRTNADRVSNRLMSLLTQ